MENLGIKLKELRKERGMTCQDMATAIGLTKNAITNYELGIREPSLAILKSICDLFDVSADYLIGRSESY